MFIRGIQFILLIGLLCLQSCGDINDGKAEGVDNAPKFPDCDARASNFELLLEKPIRSDIECAYKQINWLVNNVREEQEKSGTDNVLSKENLKLSIINRAPEAIKVLEYLDLFFDLNSFVLGSEKNLIIEDDFKALRDFLIVLNKEFSKIYKHFAPEVRDNETLYNIHYNSLNEILSTLRYIMLEASNDGEDISLKGLLSRNKSIKREINLSELFDLLKVEEGTKSWLFLKRVLIGGKPNVITNEEFLNFLETEVKDSEGTRKEHKVLKVVEVGYNLYRQLKLRFDSPQKRYSFQNANYALANELIYRECLENCNAENIELRVYKEEPLVNIMDLADWATHFFKDDLNFSGKVINLMNYDWELGRIKEIFLGNSSLDITHVDLKGVFNLLTKITNIGEDFSELFKLNQDLMLDKEKRIKKDSKIAALPMLVDRYGNEKSPYKDESNQELFEYVLKTFRYFQGSTRMPIYDKEYHRDNKSIILYGQMEYLLGEVAKFYQKEYPCDQRGLKWIYNFKSGKREPLKLFHDYYCDVGWRRTKQTPGRHLDLGQLYLIIMEFRQLFQETGIIADGEEDSAAENALSIPDLFIYSANDDGRIQVSELLEFFFGIFNAVEIKDDIIAQLQLNPFTAGMSSDTYFSSIDCRIVDIWNGEPRYETECIRRNFYNFLQQKNSRHDDRHFQYLTQLRDYYIDLRYEKEQKSLRRYTLLLEAYTKSCPYDNVPYTESDIMALYTGMFSIESTMGKFDLDGDNILSPTETEKSYEKHFKPGLWAIVKEKRKGLAEDQKNFEPYSPHKSYLDVRVAFQYLATHKAILEVQWKTLGKLVGVLWNGYPTVGRDGIANILVVMQDLTEDARKIRYERAGKRYYTPEQLCMKELPPGESKLIRKQRDCLIDGNCN